MCPPLACGHARLVESEAAGDVLSLLCLCGNLVAKSTNAQPQFVFPMPGLSFPGELSPRQPESGLPRTALRPSPGWPLHSLGCTEHNSAPEVRQPFLQLGGTLLRPSSKSSDADAGPSLSEARHPALRRCTAPLTARAQVGGGVTAQRALDAP